MFSGKVFSGKMFLMVVLALTQLSEVSFAGSGGTVVSGDSRDLPCHSDEKKSDKGYCVPVAVCQPKMAQSCPLPNGIGSRVCKADGTGYENTCVPVACNEGFGKVNGECQTRPSKVDHSDTIVTMAGLYSVHLELSTAYKGYEGIESKIWDAKDTLVADYLVILDPGTLEVISFPTNFNRLPTSYKWSYYSTYMDGAGCYAQQTPLNRYELLNVKQAPILVAFYSPGKDMSKKFPKLPPGWENKPGWGKPKPEEFKWQFSMMGNDRSVGWERKRLKGNCGPVESEMAGPTLEFTVRKELMIDKEMLGKKIDLSQDTGRLHFDGFMLINKVSDKFETK